MRRDLATIRAAPHRFCALFGQRAASDSFRRRFDQLLAFHGTAADLLRLTGIEYRSPVDASRLPLTSQSVDAHVSFTVLEHIPPDTLTAILREGQRVLRPHGLLFHCIDFSDHSAHNDPSISFVNFLQYDDTTWARLAGNRYAFHNRLRLDEFMALVDACAITTIALDAVLRLQPFEQFLNGGVMRRAAVWVKHGGDLSDGCRAAVPEHLQDSQFGIGDVLRSSSHVILIRRIV